MLVECCKIAGTGIIINTIAVGNDLTAFTKVQRMHPLCGPPAVRMCSEGLQGSIRGAAACRSLTM